MQYLQRKLQKDINFFSGKYNVLAYICTQKTKDFHNTVSEVRELFQEEIIHYEFLSSVVEYKYTYAPDCLFI